VVMRASELNLKASSHAEPQSDAACINTRYQERLRIVLRMDIT
jgi:hypothetical protein